MLNKKQIWMIFLFEFKVGREAAETTHNINNAFGAETDNEHIVQWWFKKFHKETRALKMRSTVAGHQKLTATNWEPSLKLILLKLHKKLLKNSTSTILQSFGIWNRLERWKNLVSGCLMSWLQIKKIVILKCSLKSSLTLCSNNEPFLNRVVLCNEKWILFNNQRWPAQWLDWQTAPKHFSQPNLHQKRVIVTVWWSAAWLIYYGFLNPGKIITYEKYAQQIDEMHRKLQCLQLALVNRKGPVLLHNSAWVHVAQPTLQKLNELDYQVLHHPPYSPDLLPTDYCYIKHFNNILQGKCFHNQQETENAFQEFFESLSMDFYATGINISHWQDCVDCNGSYFD